MDKTEKQRLLLHSDIVVRFACGGKGDEARVERGWAIVTELQKLSMRSDGTVRVGFGP